MSILQFTRNSGSRRALALATFVSLAATMGRPSRVEAVACSTTICSGSGTSCTIGTVTIDSGCPCSLDWGSSMDVLISGTLNADGCVLTMAANSFDITGTLRDRGGVVTLNTSGTGEFFKTRSSGSVDVTHGGWFTVNSGGECNHGGGSISADGTSPDCYGGAVDLGCGSLIITKTVHADGACTGDDSGDGGSIWLAATGSASLSGNGAVTANGSGSGSWGGEVSVTAGTTLSQGKTMQAKGGTDGTGGAIDLAAGGAVTVGGSLNTSCAGEEGDGGDISVNGTTVSSSAEWNTNGGYYDAGDVDVNGTGDVTIGGPINAKGSNGGWGGSVTIASSEDLVIDGNVSVDSGGEDAEAGYITLTGGNNHNLEVKKILSGTVGSDGGGDAWIALTGCNISVTNDIRARNTAAGFGRNALTYKGSFTLTAGDSLLADDPAATSCDLASQPNGNIIKCRCPDTNADQVCDSATCVSAPTLSGTVTPTALICPTVLPACG